ncbi:MAG: MATE family efflux transporter, partial [Eubacteriales bacterium]
ALAGVGSTGCVNFMIVGCCAGIGTGFAIPVAQSFGAKDHSSMRRFITNAIWLSLILVTSITVIVSVFCRDILILMRTPEDIINYAYDYIFIIFMGLPIMYAYNLLASIIRALGDSKSPVIFLIISALINVVLDIISVGILDLGVKGPALATLISQLISAVLCFVYMIKKFDILKIQKGEWKIDKNRIFKLAVIGIPMGLQYSITAIGSVILQISVNEIGSAAVAAITASQKISSFCVCPFDALGGTMATYAGQNTGVGNTSRIKKGVRCAIIIGAIYALLISLVLFFFGKQIILLFVDAKEAEVISKAYMHLIYNYNCINYFLLTLVNVLRFTIQGMGYSVFAILAGVFEMIARGVTGFLLVPQFGFIAACFSSPLAWIMADIFLIPAFFICLKRMKKRFSAYSGKEKIMEVTSEVSK